jgi:undecaprenyl-diphosphatase
MIERIADQILSLEGWAALLIVFALPALEASVFFGFLFPGEIAVILGGVLASENRISLWEAMVAAVLGAIIGDAVGYFVGRRFGRRILERTVGRLIHLERTKKAEEFLRERGGPAIFFGRFTAALRVLIPGLAGMSGMPYLTFSLYNIAGGIVWGAGFVLVGYFAAASWRQVHRFAGLASLVGLAVLLIGILVFRWVRARRRLRATGARPVQTATLRASSSARSASFVLLAVLCAAVFVSLLAYVMAHPAGSGLDAEAMDWTLAHRNGSLTRSMKLITWFGSSLVLVPVVLVASHDFWVRRSDWRPAASLVASWAGSILLYSSLKNLIGRPRPAVSVMLVKASGPAFPSGHTTVAMAVFGALAFFLTRDRSLRVRAWIWASFFLVILMIGASRVYLGVHWLTDILGGYAVGAAWLLLVVFGSPSQIAKRKGRGSASG